MYTPIIKKAHLISLVLFVSSLAFNCCYFQSDGISSLGALIGGWMGLFVGGANYIWLANPLLLITWLFFKKDHYNKAALTGLATSILAFSFVFAQTLVTDEGGAPHPISGLGFGYWLWLLSCFTVFISAAWLARNTPKSEA